MTARADELRIRPGRVRDGGKPEGFVGQVGAVVEAPEIANTAFAVCSSVSMFRQASGRRCRPSFEAP